MNKRHIRAFSPVLIATLIGVMPVSTVLAADAAAESTRVISIPGGDLNAALKALVRQTGVQLLYDRKTVEGLRTKGVKGAKTATDAIKELLEGTTLTMKTDTSGAILIAPPTASATVSSGEERATAKDSGAKDASNDKDQKLSSSFWDRFRLAQVDQGKATSDSSVKKEDEEQASKKKPVQLEEVLVTGSRIPVTAKEQAQPVLVFTSADIERSGRTTVADFINTLPQVSVNSSTGNFQAVAGQTGVHLHGLPLSATLTLIDGQSTELSYYGNLDLNMIPASAIERIEIIPVGSSAIYGSSALAGVVNIVTKKSFDGAEVNVGYGSADSFDDSTVNAAFGRQWDAGSLSLIASYQNRSGLQFSDRALTAGGDFTGLGGRDYRLPYCNPGTVSALGGATLAGLNASQAAIPAGLTGRPVIADFITTAGTQNRCNYYSNADLISPSNQFGLIANGHYELSPSIDIFTSVMYSYYQSDNAVGPLVVLTGAGSVMSATNAYNPFGQDVRVSWSYGQDTRQRNENFIRPLIGLRGKLGDAWNYEMTTLYSADHFKISHPALDAAALRSALDSSDPDKALNVFTSDVPASRAVLDSLYVPLYDQFRNTLTTAQVLVRGPLFSLPAGPIQTVLGGQYDRSTIRYQLIAAGQPGAASSHSRNSYAFFTEERLPLLASSSNPNDGAQLAMSLAARYDHSNDFGGKPTYQVGLEWRPTDRLLVRGSFGTAYRAPSIPLLYGSTSNIPTYTIVDPHRGNMSYPVNYAFGPNRDLAPETGRSHSFGVVYSSGLEGLETSVTYWNIDYDNYISSANVQDLITYPEDYPPGLITRASPSAQDVAKGWPGAITSVYATSVNYGKINVRGIDLDAKYRVQTAWGFLTPGLAVTNTLKDEAALRPGQPQQDYLSQVTTSPGWAPRWKGNVSLNWERGAWSVNAVGRYVGAYNDYTAYGGTSPHALGNFWLADVSAQFRIGRAFARDESWWTDSYIALGATNIFDKAPQFSYYPTLGYDYGQADVVGRTVYLRAGIKF